MPSSCLLSKTAVTYSVVASSKCEQQISCICIFFKYVRKLLRTKSSVIVFFFQKAVDKVSIFKLSFACRNCNRTCKIMYIPYFYPI